MIFELEWFESRFVHIEYHSIELLVFWQLERDLRVALHAQPMFPKAALAVGEPPCNAVQVQLIQDEG